MADLGFLNFGIGVDGEDLLAKALEKDKKEALEVQKILASIKIEGINFGGAESAVAKSQQAADKAAISSVKLGEARAHAASSSLIGEQKLQTEIEKTAAIQGKSAAEIASIEKAAADKAALAQKKIATEAERTSAVRADASRKELSDNEKLVAMLKEKEAKQTLLDQRVARGLRKQQEDQRRLLTIGPEGQVKFNNAAGLTNKTLFNQKNLLNQISNAAGIYFSIYQVGAFVKNLALVSGEFEMQRISLENISQDVDAANKLFGQIKGLAVVSPFEFKDLVGYAKQLSAFSIPVNELYDTTKRLADISAGLGVDMGRIILAYGQVRSASVLRGQELRQFTEAGIPLVDELAKKFGELEGRVVSAGEVFDKISKGLVPFAMVKDVFDDLTNEGGKFYEMQEKQSESLKGKIANLKDAYDIMLYSIGTANDGILKGGVEAISSLMKNWETFADALMAVVAAYGVYRAAIIINTSLTKSFTEATKLSTIAIKIHKAVSNATPFGLALAGITALIGGIIAYTNSISRSNAALMESIGTINKQADSCNALVDKLKLLTSATDSDKEASAERASIIAKLNNIEPDLAKNIKEHATNLKELTKIQEHYNAIMDARKFAEYAISNSGNELFNEGIINDLKDLKKAENEADMAAVKLAGKFSIIDEEWRKVKEEGKKGNFLLPESDFKRIDKIMSSSVSDAEKLAKIYKQFYQYGSPQIKGIIGKVGDYGGVVDYINEMSDLKDATKEADEEIRKLEIQLRTNFKNKGISVFDPKEADNMRTYIKNLEKLSKVAQTKILSKWGIKFETSTGDDPKNELDGWRKEIKDILGNSITITTDSNIEDTIKAIQEKIADNKKRMENLEPTLLKFGYDFGNTEFPKDSKVNDPAIPVWQKDPVLAAAESYKTLYNSQKDCNKAASGLNIELQKTGGTGSNKDLIAEKFQKQIDLIKKAQSLYEKYASIMSKEDAVKKVQNDGRFSKTFNPDDYKKSLESIYKLLGNSPEQKKVKEALRDLFGDIDYSEAKKSTDKLLETVNKEIDDYKKKYDFYKTILGITGDESLSQKIAFDAGFIGNPIELMKDKFKDVSGEEFVLGMDTSKMTASAKKMYDDIFSYQEESRQKAYESLLKMQDDLGKQDFSLFGKGWELDLSKIARDVFQKNKEINDREQKAAQELANAKGTLNESVAKAAYDNIIRLGNLERENNKKVAEEKINDLAKSVISDTLSDAGVGEIFSNLSDATFSQISAAKKALSGMDKAVLSPDVIERLNEAGVSAKVFLKILKDISNLKLDNLKDKTLGKIQDIAFAAADGISQLGDSLYALGEASGDAGLMEIGDMLGTISSLATDIAGSLSGKPEDIIKSVFSVITKFFEAEARHKKALKEINDSIIAQQRAYNILLIEQNLAYEKGNSIFGNNNYGKALNGIEEYRKISRKLKRSINAIDQIKIVTGHKKTGLFGWGKGKDTYSSILSVYPKLIKANGEFDAELAKTIIDKGKFDEASKNSLQYMIDLAEKQKEAYAQMNDYLTGLFGDLGNSMSDALVDAFKNGTDASESFYKSVSSMLEKLAKDMVYSMTIGTVIDEYKDKIGDINKNSKLTDEQRFAELAKLVSSFTKDVLAKQGEANELYKKFQEEAKKNNIDIFNPDDDGKKEGLSKGIEGVTEDTSRLIASYLNAMRADLSNQKVYFQKIIDAIIPYQNQFALQVAELKKIEANTYRTANNTEENVRILGRIEGVLNSVTRPSSGKKVNV